MYKIFLFLLLCVFAFGACKQNKVLLPGGAVFEVEIAKTPQQTERGLMFRENLEDKQGMLFIFEKNDIRLFWMKNTLIDLDMLFIDDSGAITSIAKNMPRSYLGAPEEEIAQAAGWGKYVLEVKAGTAQKYNLKEGDKLILKIK